MAKKPLTPEETREFLDAVNQLDQRQTLTLHNFAARLLLGTHYSSGVDLLHEVIIRVVDGSRHWRRDIPIGSFLHEAMRSVASVDTRNPRLRATSYEDWMEADHPLGECADAFGASPEDILAARQQEDATRLLFERAKSRLANDKEALALFKGMAQEMTPAEIRKAYGISERCYKAARSRIAEDLKTHGSRLDR